MHCLIIHEEIVHTIPQYNGLPERGHQVQCAGKHVCACLCLYDKPLVIAFSPLTRLSSAVLPRGFLCARLVLGFVRPQTPTGLQRMLSTVHLEEVMK